MFLMERSLLCDGEAGWEDMRLEIGKGREILGLRKGNVDDIVRRVVHQFQHHTESDCGCS